jgi:hypothetical protein
MDRAKELPIHYRIRTGLKRGVLSGITEVGHKVPVPLYTKYHLFVLKTRLPRIKDYSYRFIPFFLDGLMEDCVVVYTPDERFADVTSDEIRLLQEAASECQSFYPKHCLLYQSSSSERLRQISLPRRLQPFIKDNRLYINLSFSSENDCSVDYNIYFRKVDLLMKQPYL